MTSNVLAPRGYFKPFEYPQAFEFYKTHRSLDWHVEEVSLENDVHDWKDTLTKSEKNLLTHIFRFFTQADIDVAGAYVNNYLPVFPKPEVRMMLLDFASREATHIRAYSHLIDTIGIPETTYKAFLDYEVMKDKHDFIANFDGKDTSSILEQIAIFSGFTEGMQLFSSFVMLLNFRRHNKMKGMGEIISWSIRDETQHVEGMTWLFRTLLKENRELWTDELKARIYTAAETMIAQEDKFIDLAFELGGIEGMTAEEVKQYIRYIADRRLIGLGMRGINGVKENPMPWVTEQLSLVEHADFFTSRVTAYGKAMLTGSWGQFWKPPVKLNNTEETT